MADIKPYIADQQHAFLRWVSKSVANDLQLYIVYNLQKHTQGYIIIKNVYH